MLIFAHRGASSDAENTLLAIELALQQQSDGIEVDVWQLADNFVVIHDKWLSRTTNGCGQLNDYSLAQLQLLDAGHGQRIPTLWQVIEQIDNRSQLNIELKSVNCVDSLLKLLSQAEAQLKTDANKWLISSFDHHLLASINAKRPGLRIGALTSNNPIQRAQFAQQLNAWSMHVDADFVDQALVEDAHQRGIKVLAFTVDEKDDLARLAAWGVDGVFTNSPALMRHYIYQLQAC